MNILETLGEDLFGNLIGGLEKVDALLSEAVEKLGEGVEFTGEEVQKLAALMGSIGPKLEALKAKFQK